MSNYAAALHLGATLCLIAACAERRSQDNTQPQPVIAPDANPSPSNGGDNPTPIADTDPNCEAFVQSSVALSTAWIAAQISTGSCAMTPPLVGRDGSPSHDFYGACAPIGNSPAQCTLAAGMQYCEAGRWTSLCAKTADCTLGTVCLWANGVGDVPPEYRPPFGTCQKACDSTGSSQCGRCDLECNLAMGVCVTKRPSDPNPQACRADCDCDVGVCEDGFCDTHSARPTMGICGVPGADCPCNGGVCLDRCCTLPAGGLDNGTGPACRD
jgi:hypothetical protein